MCIGWSRFSAIAAGVLLLSGSVHGQVPAQILPDCQQEIEAFCPQEKDAQGVLKCLLANVDKSSDSCKKNVDRLMQAYKAKAGGGGLGAFAVLFGGTGMGEAHTPTVTYGGSVFPKGTTSSSTEQHKLTAAGPIAKDGDDTYSLSLGASSLRFGDELDFSNGRRLPRYFSRAELGGQFSRKLSGDRTFSARVSVGSASDKPFGGEKEMIFASNLTYSYPGSETSHWILTLFISNNNPIANYLPIPGFIYFTRSEKVIAMIGLPFCAVYWMPQDPWTLSASLLGPTVNMEAALGPRQRLQAFTSFAYTQQSFLRADRANEKDRIYFAEKILAVGTRSPFSMKASGELRVGYAFDRSAYESTSLFRREGGEAVLDDGPTVSWNLRYAF